MKTLNKMADFFLKWKKHLLVFFFLFGISFSCSRVIKETSREDYLDVKGIRVRLFDRENHKSLNEFDTVYYKDLEISIVLVLEGYIKTSNLFNSSSDLYAEEVFSKPTGYLDSIKIFSNMDYGSYEANTDLSGLFSVSYPQNGQSSEKILLLDYINYKPPCELSYRLFLNQPPDSLCQQQFTIIFKRTDNSFFTDTTIYSFINPV